MCQLLADFLYSLCSIAGNQIKSSKVSTFLKSCNSSSPLTCGQAYPPSPGTQRSPTGLTSSCSLLCHMTLCWPVSSQFLVSLHGFTSAPLLKLLCESWMSFLCSPPTHYLLIRQAQASLWRLPEWILFHTDPPPPPSSLETWGSQTLPCNGITHRPLKCRFLGPSLDVLIQKHI